MNLNLWPTTFAVSRLDPAETLPPWATGPGFFSVTRTADELSVVCAQESVPPGVRSDPGWRCLQVEGPLDFALTGILLSIARPLAEAGISIFAIATYDTDYVLVKHDKLDTAVAVLQASGHKVRGY